MNDQLTSACSTELFTFMGDIEVFGLSETIQYGNGGPGGFGGPGDHHGLEDMLRLHSSGGEAELTFHQLDMAVDDGQICDTRALQHLHRHAQTLKEPLRTEFLSYLPASDAGRGIGFYSLYQEVMDNHPITVINRYEGTWDLSFRYNFEHVKRVDWEDDTDGVPEALKKEPVVFIIQGGIGHFSLPFEELLGWFSLEPGYDTADFNRELRKVCFEHVFSSADEYHFGTRDRADTILWEVARCLLDAFFTSDDSAL